MAALSYCDPGGCWGRAADGGVELLGDKEGIRGPNREELEDGRIDQILEERHYDVGLDDNDGFDWSDPDR